eukprot:scaffold47157_cov68-Phaeocystis_antarctica.AAC.4
MKASRSAAAALAAPRVNWYAWYTARTEATITEASKVTIRAIESTAGSNVYEAWSSLDRRSESLTSSESMPILRTRLKNKTITREKLQSKPNSSLPQRWNGPAIDVKRRTTSEKTKAMMSCTVEPGRMSTQKPTRNSCGAQNAVRIRHAMAVRVERYRRQRAFLEISTISHQQQQRQVQERNARWVQGDSNPSQGDDPAVLGVVAIKRVVNPQEAGAVIKLLAVEGLEGA